MRLEKMRNRKDISLVPCWGILALVFDEFLCFAIDVQVPLGLG